MRIAITMDVDADLADPADKTGVTEAAYDRLLEALGEFGIDIDVRKET